MARPSRPLILRPARDAFPRVTLWGAPWPTLTLQLSKSLLNVMLGKCGWGKEGQAVLQGWWGPVRLSEEVEGPLLRLGVGGLTKGARGRRARVSASIPERRPSASQEKWGLGARGTLNLPSWPPQKAP